MTAKDQAYKLWVAAQDAPHEMNDAGQDERYRLWQAWLCAGYEEVSDEIVEPSPAIEIEETEIDEPEEQSAPINAAEELFKWQTMTPIMQHRMTPPVILSITSMGW